MTNFVHGFEAPALGGRRLDRGNQLGFLGVKNVNNGQLLTVATLEAADDADDYAEITGVLDVLQESGAWVGTGTVLLNANRIAGFFGNDSQRLTTFSMTRVELDGARRLKNWRGKTTGFAWVSSDGCTISLTKVIAGIKAGDDLSAEPVPIATATVEILLEGYGYRLS